MIATCAVKVLMFVFAHLHVNNLECTKDLRLARSSQEDFIVNIGSDNRDGRGEFHRNESEFSVCDLGGDDETSATPRTPTSASRFRNGRMAWLTGDDAIQRVAAAREHASVRGSTERITPRH